MSELVPVNRRGVYLAMVTFSILPFCPYLMYSELIGTYHTWRYSIWICMIWNSLSTIGIGIFYFPTSQTRAHGQTISHLLKKIDYFGGFLSIVGLVLFLVAMQAGGFTHPWTSAYVLVQLLIGLALIIAFIIYELKFAKYPMVPHEMFKGQTIVGTAYGIAFVAGKPGWGPSDEILTNERRHGFLRIIKLLPNLVQRCIWRRACCYWPEGDSSRSIHHVRCCVCECCP